MATRGMSYPSGPTQAQIEQTYKQMATEAQYRPAAPSDGMGNITAPLESLDLDEEARRYARHWWAEEDRMEYWIGCCDGETRPETIWAVEAARNLCGGIPGRPYALKLLKMAVAELEALAEANRGRDRWADDPWRSA